MIAIQLIVSGLLLGGIYASVAVGLTLIFGVMRVVNFAHGEYLMLGMYATFGIVNALGINVYGSMFITAPLFFIIGIISYMVLIKPIIDAPSVGQIFVTLGLSIVMQNFIQMLLGPQFRGLDTTIGSLSLRIGSISISASRLIAFLITTMLVLLLLAFIKYTYTGRAISAVAQDSDAAKIVGVNLKRIYSLAFGLSITMVSIAATSILPIYGVYPTVGASFQLISFVVVVIGGLGNVKGALFGGILIGLVETFSGFYLPVAFKEAIYFMIFIIVLWIKPAGLFGKRGFETVGTR